MSSRQHKILFYIAYAEVNIMSYQNILQDIHSSVIIGPYMAVGLKKPGENRGVWLFGESHEDGKRTKENIADDVYIGDIFAKYAEDVILLYEGEDTGFGAGLFVDAPAAVKSMVSRQTDNPYYLEELLSPTDKADIDVDAEGYNINPATEDELIMWQDDEFVDEFLQDQGDIPFVAGRFRSKGGIGVNIERPIRKYIFNGLHMADLEGKLDIQGYISSITWALNHITSSPLSGSTDRDIVASLPPIATGYINAFRKYIEYKFPRSIDDDTAKSIISTLVEMLKPTPNEPPFGSIPVFLKNGLYSDDNRYLFLVALLIDFNVTEKIQYHSDKDIVVYTGAKHSVNQMAILLKRGYVVEHFYINTSPNEDISFHRLSHTHKRVSEFSYDMSVDLIQNILNFENKMDRTGPNSSFLGYRFK